jgi:hypothetical protein
MSWLLQVRTFEQQGNQLVLVLEHRFYGATRKEAFHFSESHAKTDSFYRSSGATAASEAMKTRGGVASAKGTFQGIQTVSFASFFHIG